MSAASIPTLDRNIPGLDSRLERFSRWFLQPEVLIRVVLYCTALVYLRTILFDYVYDDNYLIILNPWMESWRQVPRFFTHSFWSFTDGVRDNDFYRPLVMLLLASIRHLLGTAPGWFHLVAVGLHVLATYLTYRLAAEITGDKTLAAIAAGIFGLHPTKVETVAWISGVSDSLCAVFFLGSLINYLRWKRQRGDQRGVRYLFASLALLLLALLSKEAAVFAPVLIAVYELISSKANFRDRCFATLKAVWPFAIVALIAMVVRGKVVQISTGQPLHQIPVLPTILTAPAAMSWYFAKQLWPLRLSVQCPVMLVAKVSFTGFVLPLIALIGLSVAAMWMIKKSLSGIFFGSWFVLMMAPIILYAIRLQVHDRYFYLTSVATSIGFAYLIGRLNPLGERAQAITILAVFASLAVLTLNYSSYWDDDLKLFTRVVEIAPHNGSGCRYLADTYITQHEPEKAEALGRSLLDSADSRAIGWYIIGNVRLSQQDYEAARVAMEESVNASPGNNLLASVALGDIDLHLNRTKEAAGVYKSQLEQYPDMPYLKTRLAKALAASSNPGETHQR